MTTKLKKGMVGVRAWLVVLESGQSQVEEVGKHSIMKRTGLHARDLRALDPVLSYPSSILGRERAIVVNLEHIKAIITAQEVLMINSNNPLVVQYVEDLQNRIAYGNANVVPPPPQQARGHTGIEIKDTAEGTRSTSTSLHGHHVSGKNLSKRRFPNDISVELTNMETNGESENSTMDALVAAGPRVLPFEFRALEACLESACRCLESETETLEEEAYPALDELTSKISTLNLERVRMIKSRLVAISGRVQKVRDELEHLLDDDNDMAEMYLTEKLAAHATEQTPPTEEVYDGEQQADNESTDNSKSGDNSEMYTSFKPNIEELEMLLEAYFAQIDGTLQKLSHMSEYVDDTEDFINIMLDDKQNQLLQMGVMLSAANMILNAGIVVVGLFGMNIHITLFDDVPMKFWETVIGTVAGCIALFLLTVGWGKRKNVLAL